MTKTQTSRRTHPWRFAVVAALTAVALLGAACSNVLAGGGQEDSGPETPGNSEPAQPGHTPPAGSGGVIDDGDTPVSDGDASPGRSPAGSGVPHESPDYPTKAALAPIDELEIAVLESYPPQYTVQIVSGLPSGCSEYSHTDVVRDGTTIKVTVWNNVPADDSAICTMIYGLHQSSVNLGSDFESGVEYTVHVNDQSITFTAQ